MNNVKEFFKELWEEEGLLGILAMLLMLYCAIDSLFIHFLIAN